MIRLREIQQSPDNDIFRPQRLRFQENHESVPGKEAEVIINAVSQNIFNGNVSQVIFGGRDILWVERPV